MEPIEKDKPAPAPIKKENKSLDMVQTFALNLLAERFKFENKDAFIKAMKEEGTQAVTAIVAEFMTSSKFKNFKEVKKEDLFELFKKHGLQRAITLGQTIIKDGFKKEAPVAPPGVPSTPVVPPVVSPVAVSPVNVSTSSLTEQTNFGEFVSYVLTNPLYKDKYSDGKVVPFIASQSAQEDIVLGNAAKWDKVIQQVRLLASTGMDIKAAQKLTAPVVESLFDKEMGQKYKEFFGLAKAPVKAPTRPTTRRKS